MHRSILLLLLVAIAITLAPRAQASTLVANWQFSEAAGATSFTDSTGNGHTGSLVGTDSLGTMTGPFGASGPTALYFHGATGNTVATGADYISVPYSSVLSGMNAMTVSAWIYMPTGATKSSPASEMISCMASATGSANVFDFGDGYTVNDRMYFYGNAPGGANDMYYWTGGTISGVTVPIQASPGAWQLVTAVYNGGTSSTAEGYSFLYVNGVLWAEAAGPVGGGNGVIPMASATVGQCVYLANGSRTRDNEWNGGLSDLAIWNGALTGPLGTSPSNGFNGNGGQGTGALGHVGWRDLSALQHADARAGCLVAIWHQRHEQAVHPL